MCVVGTENVITPLPISFFFFPVCVWDRVLGEFEICWVWPELLSAGDWGNSVGEYPGGWPQSHSRHLF